MGMSTVAPSTQPTSGKGGPPGMADQNAMSTNQGFQPANVNPQQQPQFGQPSQYSNTIPQSGWDNATIGNPVNQGGKGGKGGSEGWTPFAPSWNPNDMSSTSGKGGNQPAQPAQPTKQDVFMALGRSAITNQRNRESR